MVFRDPHMPTPGLNQEKPRGAVDFGTFHSALPEQYKQEFLDIYQSYGMLPPTAEDKELTSEQQKTANRYDELVEIGRQEIEKKYQQELRGGYRYLDEIAEKYIGKDHILFEVPGPEHLGFKIGVEQKDGKLRITLTHNGDTAVLEPGSTPPSVLPIESLMFQLGTAVSILGQEKGGMELPGNMRKRT